MYGDLIAAVARVDTIDRVENLAPDEVFSYPEDRELLR